jgi:hypothetical protein
MAGFLLEHISGLLFLSDFINFQSIKLRIPLCQDHLRPFVWQATATTWRWVLYIVTTVLLLCLLDRVIDISFSLFAVYLILVAIVGVFWYLIIKSERNGRLRATEITNKTVTLAGVHSSFTQAVIQLKEEESGRGNVESGSHARLCESDAVEIAQQKLLLRNGKRGQVRFAHYIPAHSTDPLDGDYPDDLWAVFFSMPIETMDPTIFVLHVNCRTLEVTDSPVM